MKLQVCNDYYNDNDDDIKIATIFLYIYYISGSVVGCLCIKTPQWTFKVDIIIPIL